jgi:hypothetical protein
MKVITSHFGTAAIQVVNDDVAPKRGVITKEMIEFIAERYQFSVKPVIPPQVPPSALQVLPFQSGVLRVGDEKIAVVAIALVVNGDIASGITTEQADKILDDLSENLEQVFGFRYSTATQRRIYQSNITVQFEGPLEARFEGLNRIEAILNREIERPKLPFKTKRLAFGYGDVIPAEQQSQANLEIIERTDFIIERRAGAAYEDNRYFCTAPLKTAEHIRILELLERELS